MTIETVQHAIAGQTITSVVLRGVLFIAVAIGSVYLMFETRFDDIDRKMNEMLLDMTQYHSSKSEDWLRQDVEAIKLKLDQMDTRVRNIETKVVNGK